jgi:hypothetical protein
VGGKGTDRDRPTEGHSERYREKGERDIKGNGAGNVVCGERETPKEREIK